MVFGQTFAAALFCSAAELYILLAKDQLLLKLSSSGDVGRGNGEMLQIRYGACLVRFRGRAAMHRKFH
jgi:hypothetical protein